MLTVGMKGKAETVVSENNTAKVMGSGTLDVFATPAMVALMEEAAWKCVAEALDPGMGTVGTSMQVKHLSATPLGMGVTAECELIEVDGRRLVFTVQASDEAGLIGTGTHERFIIAEEKFMAKTESKKQ
ncbi:MAG: thioesterase family protein [Clostridia bacterium]|nr:thioesterase family protein [Clostridia bacterium]